MADSEKPYTIESPTRIRLGPEAKYWAQQYGMTLEEFARYLMDAHNQRDDVEPSELSDISF
jgi:hypothetical protein